MSNQSCFLFFKSAKYASTESSTRALASRHVAAQHSPRENCEGKSNFAFPLVNKWREGIPQTSNRIQNVSWKLKINAWLTFRHYLYISFKSFVYFTPDLNFWLRKQFYITWFTPLLSVPHLPNFKCRFDRNFHIFWKRSIFCINEYVNSSPLRL